jgi:regulator of sigma E protease
VENIIEDTPAAKANFPHDVVIWSVDGKEITNVEEFVAYLSDHKNTEIKIKTLSFEGQWKDVSVIPSETGREGVLLGVEFYDVMASFYKLDYSNTKIFSGLSHTINFTGYTLDVFKDLIIISFKEKSVTPVSEGVSSPVGVANRIFELVRAGDIIEIFNLAAGVNLSLAIINLVPIPGLDGGYLIFLLLEKIRGKKVAEKYQEWATKIGFVFLITLGILVTVKDFVQFDIIPRFGNLIKSLF